MKQLISKSLILVLLIACCAGIAYASFEQGEYIYESSELQAGEYGNSEAIMAAQKTMSKAIIKYNSQDSTITWSWDGVSHPVAPTIHIEFTGEWVTPEAGGIYYIYNVGAGLFLGGGQTWGTRGIVLCDSVVLVDQEPVAINNTSGNTTANYIFPMELVEGSEEGQFNISVLNNSKAASGSGYFTGEDGRQAWIDGDASRNSYFGAWNITPYQSGYMIQNVNASTVKFINEETGEVTRSFGVDGYNVAAAAGWATTWTDLYINNTEDDNILPWLEWRFVDASEGEAVREYSQKYKATLNSDAYKDAYQSYQDAMVAYQAQQEILTLKQVLLDTMVEGEDAGIDVSTYMEVYNNPNATLEEVYAAIAAVKAAIGRLQWDFFSYASEENPLDITDLVIENPTFNTDMSGWTITLKGQNIMRQARTDGTVDPSKNWVQITNFIEAWTPNSGALGDGTISQTVYGLPKGKYVLECDAMATLQGQPEDSVRGAYIFIEGSDHETRSAIKSPDTQPKHWSVTFINGESDYLTFGLKVENTTANWISADNFQLTFYGETEESLALATLRVSLSKAKETIIDDVYAEAVAKEAFTAAISKAEDDIEAAAGDEAYEVDNAALQAATEALNASIAVYETLNALINRATSTSEEIAEQWAELADDIDSWIEETLTPAYEYGTFNAEAITAAEVQLSQMIRDLIATPGKVQPGDKVTVLIENADYSNGLTGWTVENRDGGNFGTKYGGVNYALVECWRGTFDVYQVIHNMPRGAYKLKVQGYALNYELGTGESTVELYAGMTTTRIKDYYSEWSTRPYVNDGILNDATFVNGDGETVYAPGGMASAQKYFADINPLTGDLYYMNYVDIVLPEDGDLRIGVRGNDKHSWTLWDNFELEYAGNDASLYEETIRTLVDELQALTGVDSPFITARAAQLIDELPTKAETAINNADADECIALIKELNDAIEYIKAGNAAGAALVNEANLYNDYLINVVASSYNDFLDLVSTIADYASDATAVADNDAIAALSAQLKSEWGKYVMYDVEASEYNPVDVSAVILNNNYANEMTTGEINGSYWTTEEGNPGFQSYPEIEFYNQTFNHYQTLEGLRPGYYIVRLDGFYRAGFAFDYTDSLAAVNNAVVYAISSFGTATVGLANAAVGVQEENLGSGTSEIWGLAEHNGLIPNNMEAAYVWISADLYSNSLCIEVDEDGVLTIGVKKSEQINGDWTVFSNWQLEYYGTERPSQWDAHESQPVETFGEVGSEDVICEFYVSKDFSGTSVSVDVAAIAELLGSEMDELTFQAVDSETGSMTDNPSASNGGYWLNSEGCRCAFSEGYFYIEPISQNDYSSFTIGQWPGKLSAGNVYTAQLYLVYGKKYYTLNFILKPIEKQLPEFVNVATKEVRVQIEPANAYDTDVIAELDMSEIETLVGTSGITLFGTERSEDGDVKYTDDYSLTPKPGFWIDTDGYASVWGQSPWGFSFANSVFTFYQMPNQNAYGDTYKSIVYLVNLDNGQMVTVVLNVQFVDKSHILGDANCDGSVDIVDVTTVVDFILENTQPDDRQWHNADVNEDGYIDVVDLTSIVQIILGVYNSPNGASHAPARPAYTETADALTVYGSDIVLTNSREYVAFQMDVTLAEGATLRGVNLADRAVGFAKTFRRMGDNNYRIVVYSPDNRAFIGNEGVLLSLDILGEQVGVSVSNAIFTDAQKAYALSVNDLADGIRGAALGSKTVDAYDISGRRVVNTRKHGIYIVNGKAISVK